MADSDDIDLEGDDHSDSGSSKKRGGGGLGNLLPTLLKFAAIGLGALIFIVTVAVITYNIMNAGGRSQTVITDPLSPYVGRRPTFSYFSEIGQITTQTRDTPSRYSVTVEVLLGYDEDDVNAFSELNSRRHEIRDFLRRYFTTKTAADLAPEREEDIKREIREQLNTRFLDSARVRLVLFNRLDVIENF